MANIKINEHTVNVECIYSQSENMNVYFANFDKFSYL